MPWRAMGTADLAEVRAIAAEVHPDHPERPEVFAERLALFPRGCFMLGTGGGYAIAHPGVLGRPPALDTLLGALPPRPDCLYLHDVALLPDRRSRGESRLLLTELQRLASSLGLRRLALVAVSGSEPVWQRLGFRPAAATTAGYGGNAVYMTRKSN